MNHPHRLATIAALCLLPTVTAAAAPNIQPILLSNQPLPDASGDLVGPNLLFLQATSLSRNGDVALTVRAYDPSSSTSWFDQNVSATLLWSAGSLSTVLNTDGTVGAPGTQILSIGQPVLSPNGRFLALGIHQINNTPPSFIDDYDAYLWDRTTNGPGPFAPVLSDPKNSSLDTFQVNNAGVIAATAYESNAVNVLTGRPSQLQHLVSTGSPLPGGDAAGESRSIAINSAGQILFTSTTDQISPGATNLYLATPAGTLQTLAARNAPAPGIPGALFSDLQTPAGLSDSGRTAFAAAVVAPGLHTTSDQGIWVGSPGSLHLLAREGDPAPNAAGQVFASFSNPAISPDGHVAFIAGFTSSSDGGDYARDSLWLSDPAHADQLAKVAAIGDPTPGIPTGTFSNFSGFSLSSTGLIAFTADALIPRDADDPVVILANHFHLDPSPITTTGLWIGTPGDLHLLLQKDDPFDLNGQTMYAVAFNLVGTGSYGNGNPLGLTDDGRLLVSLTYRNADATLYADGLFLLSLPEPTCLSLLLIPTLLLPYRRRTQTKFFS